MEFLRRHKLFIGLIIAYIFLATLNIGFQSGFVGDEQAYVVGAWQIFSGGPRSNLEHPMLAKTMQGFFAAISVLLGCDPVIGMRFAAVAAGAGALTATYALALRWFSLRAAFGAAVMCLCNTLFLVHARMVSPEMVALFLMMLGLHFFLADRIQSDPTSAGSASLANIALAGTFLGLSLSAKWIGVWLVPWALARLAYSAEFKKMGVFLARLILFYAIGNAAYFLNHGLLDAAMWQKYILTYHQTSAGISAYNGSPAWTWFAIPQHLYYSRLVPDRGFAMSVMSAMNPVVFLLTIPALWMAMKSGASPACRLLAESAVCLYVPWLLVPRPTYFFYALTLLPILAILESHLLMRIMEQRPRLIKAVTATFVTAVACFALFYPAAVGVRIGNGYEKMLAQFNFYKRPVFNGMMCQGCNLYFGSPETENP